ncbi:MAG: class I SAM-dependent methyltransferase [Clostridiales bacterium]|nr:class I SAM-dependent methyltransferase [Clostridiales bacterium]MCF8022228.1 class I SAM-dependent methyltransferase [Clostridiales bacterium]
MKELFDGMVEHYDRWYSTAAGRVIDRIEKGVIFQFLNLQAGDNVLDAGCGTGNYSLDLHQKGFRVTGTDISKGMIEKARKKASSEIQFIKADVCSLPFESNSFDSAVSVTALEFVPEIYSALQEIYRVVKVGGRIVVGVIGKNSSWERYYLQKAHKKKNSVFNSARFYTLGELRSLMPGRLIGARAALFIPPHFDFSQQDVVMQLETAARERGREDGGFICAASIKE